MFGYERLERLFDPLLSSSPALTARLSNTLGVSDRTIRTDISKLNEELRSYGAAIKTKWHEGYYIYIADSDAFAEFTELRRSVGSDTGLESAGGRVREALRIICQFRRSFRR